MRVDDFLRDDVVEVDPETFQKQIRGKKIVFTEHAGARLETRMEGMIDAPHCPVHDAYYDADTGAWLETVCEDLDCFFCCDRPEIHASDCDHEEGGRM